MSNCRLVLCFSSLFLAACTDGCTTSSSYNSSPESDTGETVQTQDPLADEIDYTATPPAVDESENDSMASGEESMSSESGDAEATEPESDDTGSDQSTYEDTEDDAQNSN